MAKTKAKSSSVDCSPPCTSESERRRYQVEDALRTLERAEEIKEDKSLMREVAKVAKDKSSDLDRIATQLGKRGLISPAADKRLRERASK